MSTDVQFPLAGLDLRPYLSSDLMSPDQYRAQLSTIDNVFRINAVNTNDDINNSNGDAVDSRRSNSHIIASSMSQVNGATRGSKSSLIQGVTRMDDHNDLQCSMDSLMNNKGSVAGSPSLNTDALEDSLESLNMNSIPFPNAIHEPVYDLIGVSNHHGNLHGGHYVAHVNVNAGDKQSNPENSKWMCFNDSRVSNAIPTSIAGPTAYVLFYRLRE